MFLYFIKHIICISFLLFGFFSYGQSDYRFRNYTISNGLSQSSINSIVQDDINALWIGTQDGLNRFDGKSFEIFSSDETEGLESEYVLCSLKDRGGNLWFGTSKGLTHYDLKTEEFTTYNPSSGEVLHIEDIAEDHKGDLWLATAESGLYRFDAKKKSLQKQSDQIPSNNLNNVESNENGLLLVSTENMGVYLYDIDRRKRSKIQIQKKSSSNLTINNIIITDQNNAILATNQGAYDLNLKTQNTKVKFANLDAQYGLQSISDLIMQEDIGWLVCTNNNGLFTIKDKGRILHSTVDIFQKTSLLFNELNVIFKDAAGTLWVGSQRGLSSFSSMNKGILSVGPTGNPSRGVPTASVWSFGEDNGGEYVFIGTDKGVSRMNRTTGMFKQYYRNETTTFSTGQLAVLAIEVINPNKALIGCTDGFFELNINNEGYSFDRIIVNKNNQYKHSRVYSITQWKNQLYWLATKDGAVLYNSTNKTFQTFEHDPEQSKTTISQGVCRVVYKDKKGNIWFTTSTGGLSKLKTENGGLTIEPYKHNHIIKKASTEFITSMHDGGGGIYWLGTIGSGLIKWNEKTRKTEIINKTRGLPNDVVYSIVATGKRSLWISTNKGLSNINTNSLKVKNYNEVDGLLSNEFNLGAFMLSNTGIVYFGGIYGYTFFDPKSLSSVDKEVGVVFTKFKLDNEWLKPNSKNSPLSKSVFLTNEIYLSYSQRSFTLAFQSSDLSNPELINYKWILEGSDEGEMFIGSMNEIPFYALSHGEYKLKVYARYGDGKWSRDPATMTIVIATPIWFTWWFWLLILVVLAISIRYFIRKRIESSRREQVRLEIKIRDRTREIQKQSKKIELQNKKIEEEKNNVLKQQELLKVEKDKSERLLKKVIPESTAEELKKKGKARARAYKTVSVLFTDFVGFTKIADEMSATDLVKKLDVYFTKFDEIIVRNDLEKIKTIGDAYMCAGGVPVRNKTNPIDACLAALQIQAYMMQRKSDAIANGKEYWELRLGINTGEVTAGVIGSERLAYDIWGATVNQAQQMEMLGEPGKVTITGALFKHIEPYFECSFLGKAQTKSSGMVDMYVVHRIKPELSIKEEGIFPNDRFNQIVNLHHYSPINYYKAERHIMKVLEQGLSRQLHYHSIAHTRDVVSAVERLALLEDVTDEGLFLLKSAATYHDAGFVEEYDNNEPIGARLADEILPKYGYTEQHIEKIKELIYVTQIPHSPKNQLEEIICDADLDYLGRDDFHEIAGRLCRELIEHGKIKDEKQWDEIQVSFLTSHKYFTKTAKKTRSKKKQKNLQEVIKRLKEDKYKS